MRVLPQLPVFVIGEDGNIPTHGYQFLNNTHPDVCGSYTAIDVPADEKVKYFFEIILYFNGLLETCFQVVFFYSLE